MNHLLALRMSVLGGILKLQLHCTQKPDLSTDAIVDLLRHGSVLDTGFDFERALQLLAFLRLGPTEIPPDRYEALRVLIGKIIHLCKPPWAIAIPDGRKQVVRLMLTDEQQCFASAGLLTPYPSQEVLSWWDEFARIMRAQEDNENAETGREAERLSLEYERNRLIAAGRVDLEPVWVALDDNSLGYDIRSFEPDGSLRYLEVKGCQSSDLMIYITRNEWRTAAQHGDKYHFHVWDLKSRKLYPVSREQIAPHVPIEQGRGQWRLMRLSFLTNQLEANATNVE